MSSIGLTAFIRRKLVEEYPEWHSLIWFCEAASEAFGDQLGTRAHHVSDPVAAVLQQMTKRGEVVRRPKDGSPGSEWRYAVRVCPTCGRPR